MMMADDDGLSDDLAVVECKQNVLVIYPTGLRYFSKKSVANYHFVIWSLIIFGLFFQLILKR